MIKGILFDKDGTIIDFFKLWQPAVAPVLNRLIDDYQLYPKSLYFPKLERAIGILDGQIDPEGAIAWKPYQLIAEDLGQVIQEVQVDLDYQLLTHRLQDYFAEAVAAFKGEIPTFTDMISLFFNIKRRRYRYWRRDHRYFLVHMGYDERTWFGPLYLICGNL